MSGLVILPQIPCISVGDAELAAVDMTDLLDSGELITGTPTVVEVTTSDLTIGNVTALTAETTINGTAVAIGKGIQYSVSGQLVGLTYLVKVTCVTDSTPARTLNRGAKFEVAP